MTSGCGTFEVISDRGEMTDDRGIERPKEGHHLGANARAQVTGVRVGRVGREGNVMSTQMRHHVRTLGPNEGPDQIGPDRTEDGEAPRAGPPKDAHEHGFRAIFGVMSGRNDGAVGFCGSTQRRPSRLAGPSLEIAAPRHIDPRSPERHAELARKALGEIELSRSLGPEPMVDAMGPQRHAHLGPEPRQT